MNYKSKYFNFRLKCYLLKTNLFYGFFNNGWRTITSVKDIEKQYLCDSLPIRHEEYDLVISGKFQYRYYYKGSISDEIFIKSNVSHFRISNKHKHPNF